MPETPAGLQETASVVVDPSKALYFLIISSIFTSRTHNNGDMVET